MSNVRLRPNIVSVGRYTDEPGTAREGRYETKKEQREDFQTLLEWRELRLYADLFWVNRRAEVERDLTEAQRLQRDAEIGRPTVNAFFAVNSAPSLPVVRASEPAEPQRPGIEPGEGASSAHIPRAETAVSAAESEDEQSEFVNGAWQSKSLVLAAAGTGKSHAVLRRLAILASRDFGGDLTPVLMVSMSNQAIAELRARLTRWLSASGGASALQLPNFATLDSFSGSVLHQIGQGNAAGDFDAAIQRLRDVLRGTMGEEARESAQAAVRARARVIIIDEAQDIVGLRAQLVDAILTSLGDSPHGVSLLGDLRQAIYGFSVDGPDREFDCFWLVRRLRALYRDVAEYSFARQRRFDPELAGTVLELQQAMDTPGKLPGEDPDAVRLHALLTAIPVIEDPRALFGEQFSGKAIAVLARSNEMVARVGAVVLPLARQRNRSARVVWARDRKTAPGWVARAMQGMRPGEGLPRAEFVLRTVQSARVTRDLAERMFDWVLEAFRLGGEQIDVSKVAPMLQAGRTAMHPLPMRQEGDEIVVCTVHQAKGREFGVVVIVDAGGALSGAEECRVAYVAATRARETLRRCAGREWAGPALPPPESPLDWIDGPETFDVASAGGVSGWTAAQDALWEAVARGEFLTLLYSPHRGAYVLEPAGPAGSASVPTVMSGAFGRCFEHFARRRLGVADPQSGVFYVDATELRTTATGQSANPLALFPVLSGYVRR